LEYANVVTRFDEAIDKATQLVLADAQTSGGLLLFLPRANATDAVTAMADQGVAAAIIGEIASKGDARIQVAP
jgi:selenide,water dikinase